MEVQPLKKVSPMYLRKKVYGTSHRKGQTEVPTEENRTSHRKGQTEGPVKRTGSCSNRKDQTEVPMKRKGPATRNGQTDQCTNGRKQDQPQKRPDRPMYQRKRTGPTTEKTRQTNVPTEENRTSGATLQGCCLRGLQVACG